MRDLQIRLYQFADDSMQGRQVGRVGNKKGTYVHIHSVKKVSKEEWEKAQPKPVGQQQASAR